jgi:hypothetical protein
MLSIDGMLRVWWWTLGFRNRRWFSWSDKRPTSKRSVLCGLGAVRVCACGTVTRCVQPYKVQVFKRGPTRMTCAVHSHIYAIREQSAQALASFPTAHFLNSHYKLLNQNFGRTLAAAKEIAWQQACPTFLVVLVNSTKPFLHAGHMMFGTQNVDWISML